MSDAPAPALPDEPGGETAHALPAALLVGAGPATRDRPGPARDAYAGALFARRARYAEAAGRPWYVLSARRGLVPAGELVAPVEDDLAALPDSYHAAWGGFVAEQLRAWLGSGGEGQTVELHADESQAAALRGPLAAAGFAVVEPVTGRSRREAIAWYDTRRSGAPARRGGPPGGGPDAARRDGTEPGGDGPDGTERDGAGPGGAEVTGAEPAGGPPGTDAGAAPRPGGQQPVGAAGVEAAVRALTDQARGQRLRDLAAAGPAGHDRPGLYAWWVDAAGADELAAGLGLPLPAGLLYVGQAGATSPVTGRPSSATLWSRVGPGSGHGSTFHRTLAAVLAGPLGGLAGSDDPRLAAWAEEHLRVALWPVDDPVALADLEEGVLAALEPPLNLQGMRETPVHRRLRALRRGTPA